MTIQIKAAEQYFQVKGAGSNSKWIKTQCVTTQIIEICTFIWYSKTLVYHFEQENVNEHVQCTCKCITVTLFPFKIMKHFNQNTQNLHC